MTDLRTPCQRDTEALVCLFGTIDCHKTRFYEDVLRSREIDFVLKDVTRDKAAEDELRTLFSNRQAHFPTFLIAGKKLRNPKLRELERALAHAGIYDPGLINEPRAKRFVKFMAPEDAFVSYHETDALITLTHIEVPISKRGSGLGAKLALGVFPKVKALEKPARITCSFMRKVAASDPEWADYFKIYH